MLLMRTCASSAVPPTLCMRGPQSGRCHDLDCGWFRCRYRLWHTVPIHPVSNRPCLEQLRHLLKPSQGERSGLTQIRFRALLVPTKIGIPVPGAALFAFLACGVLTGLASEGEAGSVIQPG